MPSKVIDEIEKADAKTVSSAYLPTGDAKLVVAARSGDAQAFEVLIGRYQRRILAVALRFTRLREDAEDVVQQSFQKAFVHMDKFEGKSSFSTWLTRIVINEAKMLLRRRRGTHEVSIDDSGGNEETAFGPKLPDPGPGPEDSYWQRERNRILSAAMKKLTVGTRTAIELRELCELSTRETARLMGLSVGAVKARVFHGRRKLRETLKRYVGSGRTSERDISQTSGDARPIAESDVACNACS